MNISEENTEGNSESSNLVLTITSGSFNIVMAFPLNCYVIWLILRGIKKTSDTDVFSLNLAFAEIFICSSALWFYVYKQTSLHLFYKAFTFSLGLIFTARPLFQGYICLEYYVGVVHPVLFLNYKPLRYRMAICCIAWLTVLSSCIYAMFTFFVPRYHYAFFVQNLLILSVILFCCLSVLKALKHPGPGDKESEKKTRNKAKRRAFKIIFIIMTSMIINFVLYLGVIPLQCCIKRGDYTNTLIMCANLALATGFVQPILYLYRSGKLTCFKRS